jgi:hypothetical protein
MYCRGLRLYRSGKRDRDDRTRRRGLLVEAQQCGHDCHSSTFEIKRDMAESTVGEQAGHVLTGFAELLRASSGEGGGSNCSEHEAIDHFQKGANQLSNQMNLAGIQYLLFVQFPIMAMF